MENKTFRLKICSCLYRSIHLKIRRDTISLETFYVLLGVKEDYTKEALGIVNIPSQSASG